ncbi:maltokinase N-terminal cap-like domain-containing protein [Streptomyces sp. NPDC002867]
MAVIHHTTLTPSKLDLLASWLPAQPWYAGTGHRPELTKAGGFRLDDPQGEVGIEFMMVTDGSGNRPLTYHVPLSYRGAPLDGSDHALIGTAEHGVLGRRWIYDGTHDPVLVTQLLNAILGHAEPQTQDLSNTPDHSVTHHFSGTIDPAPIRSTAVTNRPDGTHLTVETTTTADPHSEPTTPLTIRVTRILPPADHSPAHPTQPQGHITAGWHSPHGTQDRGPLAVLYDQAPPRTRPPSPPTQ